jgi:hypothetical protein
MLAWRIEHPSRAYKARALPLSYASKMALGAGFEPARLPVNSRAHCRFATPEQTWWVRSESNALPDG